jgi:hypothetical protein
MTAAVLQLCLTIAAAAAQQGEAVFLIDTLKSVRAERLAQILRERFRLVCDLDFVT